MTRKTSSYARRRQRTGQHVFNTAEWLNTIQRCKPYSNEAPPGGWVDGTQSAATNAMLLVRSAFDSIKSGSLAPMDVEPFDRLSHAMGVSCIRAGQIAGEAINTNPMLQVLVPANGALRRCLDRRRRLGVWGFDGPGLLQVMEGLEVYETILQASSPAQMTNAVQLRDAALQGATQESLEDA